MPEDRPIRADLPGATEVTAVGPEVTVIGPGPRTAALGELLLSSGGASAHGHTIACRLEPSAPSGRLILDADRLGRGDAHLLRSFLEHRPGWSLVLIGGSSSAELEAMDGRPRVTILVWPLDAATLAWLVPGARSSPPPRPVEHRSLTSGCRTRARAIPSSGRPSSPSELAAVEAILGRPRHDRPDPPSEALAPGRGFAIERPVPDARELPDYYRDQVAELADIAQCLELGLEAARTRPREREQLEPLRIDLARLVRFTRTLGYLVRRPVLEAALLDLGQVLEDLLATRARSRRTGAEVLLRREPAATVRADRELLSQCLGTLLDLAEACAEGSQSVRIEVAGAAHTTGSPRVRLALEFPIGPLAALDPIELARPYALRRLLPELGPNDLAAAASIVESHGGQLVFRAGTRPELLAGGFELPLQAG